MNTEGRDHKLKNGAMTVVIGGRGQTSTNISGNLYTKNDLLNGESKLIETAVSYGVVPGNEIPSFLVVTNFRLILTARKHNVQSASSISRGNVNGFLVTSPSSSPTNRREEVTESISIPLANISKADKEILKKEKVIELVCKDFRNIKLGFMPQTNICERAYDYIIKFAFPEKTSNLFAFDYKLKVPLEKEGWKIYNPIEEYKRIFRQQDMNANGWRFTDVNNDFKFSPTYPKQFVVPYSINDDLLAIVGDFRSKNRIPILSWWHPQTKASLTRCSQPKVGLGSSKSVEDEQMLMAILKTTPNSNMLYVLDARPKVNAVANRAAGGGSENVTTNTDVIYLNIDNIHVMRSSHNKLKEIVLSNSGDSNWLSSLESTRWLEFISLLLSSSTRIAKLLVSGYSVLAHCSDGWDRTSQVISLSMLYLDSYYRTIQGFMILIEKEFIQVGHKFEQRTGHGQKNYADSQRAPIFSQFIDCVWQLTQQFPTAFQFNENLLHYILESLYSCLYGTFLCNNQREKEEQKVEATTVSLWSFINLNLNKFTNPHYQGLTKEYLFPSCEMKYIRFWTNYYLKHFKKPNESGDQYKMCELLKARIQDLEEALQLERNKVEVLEKQIKDSKVQTNSSNQSSPRGLSPITSPKSSSSSNINQSIAITSIDISSIDTQVKEQFDSIDKEIDKITQLKLQAAQNEQYETATKYKNEIIKLNTTRKKIFDEQIETINSKLDVLENERVKSLEFELYESAAAVKKQIFELRSIREKIITTFEQHPTNSPKVDRNQLRIELDNAPRDSVVDLRNMIQNLLSETQKTLHGTQ